ncbi:signal peptidase I [Tessaracoccus sp. ZS01]|uniref:signal peptidase I n=1 Tax=Tessaracoccus sp. ZS01 TaxID=1906324 RepID=UPI00096DC7EC|nr:signal peptidase I [Tessaracoccus sp. ZS01]MCG6566960.1 signal peptidase I [Tessaracoccus sp. ZS01]OMG58084.1 signal peptidase I [Tessaracoccus sp. ZS01]
MTDHAAAQPAAVRAGRCRRLRAVVGWAMVTAVVLCCVALAVVTNMGNYHLTRVLSNSMAPTFSVGDHVIVQDRPAAELAAGQIVVLPQPGSSNLFIHRILTVEHGGDGPIVTTQGDNNPAPDAWTLRVTSPTVPVFVAALPTHGLPLPTLPAATSQVLLALGLAALSLLLLLPGRTDRSARSGGDPANP